MERDEPSCPASVTNQCEPVELAPQAVRQQVGHLGLILRENER
jgi:hypothetical protein